MDVNSLTNIDSIQWNHAFPETNGIVHVCHNSDFSRFFVSSSDHAFFVYSTSLTDSTFAVAHSFVGHSSDITDVVSDYQNTLISVSSDHHMIVTDLSSSTTTLDVDCGFALSTLTSYGEWIVTAGASYSVLFISLAFPSRVHTGLLIDCVANLFQWTCWKDYNSCCEFNVRFTHFRRI